MCISNYHVKIEKPICFSIFFLFCFCINYLSPLWEFVNKNFISFFLFVIYYILVTLCLCWTINQTGKVLIYYFNAWVVNKLFKHLHKYTLFCLIYFMSCTKQKSHKSTNPTTQCRANSEWTFKCHKNNTNNEQWQHSGKQLILTC